MAFPAFFLIVTPRNDPVTRGTCPETVAIPYVLPSLHLLLLGKRRWPGSQVEPKDPISGSIPPRLAKPQPRKQAVWHKGLVTRFVGIPKSNGDSCSLPSFYVNCVTISFLYEMMIYEQYRVHGRPVPKGTGSGTGSPAFKSRIQ